MLIFFLDIKVVNYTHRLYILTECMDVPQPATVLSHNRGKKKNRDLVIAT